MHFPFVDRLHVSASEAQVEEALRRALKPGVSEAQVKKVLKIALKQHRENRELYGFVMGGMHRPKRKNPELLIVRNPGRRKMARKKRKTRRTYTQRRRRAQSILLKYMRGQAKRSRRSFVKSAKAMQRVRSLYAKYAQHPKNKALKRRLQKAITQTRRLLKSGQTKIFG